MKSMSATNRKSISYKIVEEKVLNWTSKGHLLHFKIILKIQLIENKEVTLFVQLNW